MLAPIVSHANENKKYLWKKIFFSKIQKMFDLGEAATKI